MENTKKVRIVRKDGKGCDWYIDYKDIHSTDLVRAYSPDGFVTMVRLEDYRIIL